MLGLWDARGAQDGGRAAAAWLHPGGQTPRRGCGAAGSRLTGEGTMPLGYSRAGPPPTTAFSLSPMDRLCSERSGLYVGQAQRRLRHCHEGIKLNKDPPFSLHPMPSPWRRAVLALVLKKKSISLRFWARLSKASVCAAPGPARTLCPGQCTY